jgi:hypothetical protein
VNDIVVDYFKVLSQHLEEWTVESHKTCIYSFSNCVFIDFSVCI